MGLTITQLTAQTNPITIEVADASVTAGDELTLPIYLNPNGTDLVSAFSTKISYDSTKVEILSCTPTTFTGACNINTSGIIEIAGYHLHGAQTKTQIAAIKLKANSSTQHVTKLTPNTSLIGNANGDQLTNIDNIAGDINISLASPEFAVYIPILQAP